MDECLMVLYGLVVCLAWGCVWVWVLCQEGNLSLSFNTK